MKLKAEEAIKRLADGSDAAAIRRKVGGLPPHLSIFELGFAGKGRIYYTRGRQRALPRALGGREEHAERRPRVSQPAPDLSARRSVALSLRRPRAW